MDVVDEVVQGRAAFARREWACARDRLAAAVDGLGPDDLDALAVAAYLCGDRETCLSAWQRAFQAHAEAAATLRSVRVAFWIGFVLFTAGREAEASGWAARAARLLADEPEDTAEQAYLDIHQMFRHIHAGEVPAALALATGIADAGRRHRDADLLVEGLVAQGRLMIYGGRVREGLALLDEAMLGVAEDEVSPIFAGMAICALIEACQELGDYRRMTEWTGVLTRWCDAQPDLVPFTGQCAVHRAQLLRWRGEYDAALAELGRALDRYRLNGDDPAAGLAVYERAEVLRVRGDHEGAASAYQAAGEHGHDPQPGLALLWLASGRGPAASAAVRRLLGEYADPVHRAALLPAAVEVLLAEPDLAAARAAADELTGTAASFGCPALVAHAACADGAVSLAAGDAGVALPSLRRGWRLWQDLGARYDAARVRALIGLAFRALGDEDSALAELAVARRTFVDLGAADDVRRLERLLVLALPDGLTAREVEVLRLVAQGSTNLQIARNLFLSEKTVARHLSNIFGKIGVSSRTAAAAYAFEHRLADSS
ncbi:LuxR C-terminal-related transcriptional regulator [Pimelobacter simplex]|uniref:LuxR C-terminal-related transcriptional regulator n=1 Tax=Nocardioides simplex TaxID=2045 RepID=UPI0019342B7D|nr:response regulator transcription factor [Pimelobacter simplex]